MRGVRSRADRLIGWGATSATLRLGLAVTRSCSTPVPAVTELPLWRPGDQATRRPGADETATFLPVGSYGDARRPYQFSMERVKIPAMSSSVTGRGQVASSRCCFMVPGTSEATSDSS